MKKIGSPHTPTDTAPFKPQIWIHARQRRWDKVAFEKAVQLDDPISMRLEKASEERTLIELSWIICFLLRPTSLDILEI